MYVRSVVYVMLGTAACRAHTLNARLPMGKYCRQSITVVGPLPTQPTALICHKNELFSSGIFMVRNRKSDDSRLGCVCPSPQHPSFNPTRWLFSQVALVRVLARTIDDFVDHYRLERDFHHLLDSWDHELEESSDEGLEDGNGERQTQHPEQFIEEPPGRPHGGIVGTSLPSRETRAADELDHVKRPRQLGAGGEEEEYLAPEDMPVTIVIKADSANTLASVLDAVGDWGDVENPEDSPGEHPVDGRLPEKHCAEGSPGNAAQKSSECSPAAGNGREEEEGGQGLRQQAQCPRLDWGEKDLQHKQRRRLVVSVARSGIGAVTTSDVRLARDCECPVFAHNVRADAAAARELRRVGGAVVKAMPEGAVGGGGDEEEAGVVGVGGREGFIGRAGEGRECVVVSETVGELLGEIERFVLRVR